MPDWTVVFVPLLVVSLVFAVVWLCVERSRRRGAERALTFQKELQAMVMDATPTPILVQDRQGRYLAVNPAFEDALGLRADQLIGRPVSDAGMLDSHGWAKLRNSLQQVFATGVRVKDSIHFMTADGERREALYWVRACVSTSGRIDAVLAAFLDVSDLRRMERAAEAASAAKDTLLATVSHELRTPLSGVVGLLELLGVADIGSENQRLVGTARAAAGILTSILDDVLTYSAAIHGKPALRIAPVSIDCVSREIGQLVAPTAHKKGLDFEVNLSAALAPAYMADPRRVGQILLNLLGNAVKFTEVGGVSLRVFSEAAAPGHETVLFEVSDTGIGIDPSERTRVFSPFVRGKGAGHEVGGVGLGLAVTHGLVKAMGGEILVTERDGGGTTMLVSLPLAIAVDELAATDALRPDVDMEPDPVTGAAAPMHLLVVENEALNRDLLKLQISRLGMTCDAVEDATQALHQLTLVNYDAVITDCTMPGMSGVELIARLRQFPACHHLPVYALTANATPSLRQACMDAGADEVLIKPVDLATLRAVLAQSRMSDPALERAREALSLSENPELKRRFLNSLSEIRASLATLDQEQDQSRIGELAHRAAGAAAWFGLHGLAQIARETEDSVLAGMRGKPLAEMTISLSCAIATSIAQVAGPESGTSVPADIRGYPEENGGVGGEIPGRNE
ncbi:hybrid sensor histidine kinase/response regulator [Pandoraea bronchicola]|uniref:histidine kinase n=1 Tax=Pandoraea bronchicola TaxID=2508287 RepID=A0A5E5BW15_9BURK|nr:PAS domain-containing hybrid sensor histidine kinase/response regulator [Pandoraea bronchicola]VVE90511.1 hybrid sensor histidine kinase/response regulator [Pandoraea bronchicola]